MKVFLISLLGAMITILLVGSFESVIADHSLTGKGFFKDEDNVNLISTKDPNSEYHIHIQVEIRNTEGQLINVAENDRGLYIPHEIAYHTFNKLLGKKEIVIIDNIKYEKVQFTDTPNITQLIDAYTESAEYYPIGFWVVQLCGEVDGHEYKCLPVFQTNTAVEWVSNSDIIKNQWTILREIS